MARVDILAHRGWWEASSERNTAVALRRAFAAGLGVETDLRDLCGEVVISHDPPIPGAGPSNSSTPPLTLRDMLAIYAELGSPGHLALNIKADGLQKLVMPLLKSFNVSRYFVFDMSVPDTLAWLAADANVFVRHSEYEPSPVLYDQAAGIWIDAYRSDWYDGTVLAQHLAAGKQVGVVSPEIHGRDPVPVWKLLNSLSEGRVLLCTDRVAEARRFFHGDH